MPLKATSEWEVGDGHQIRKPESSFVKRKCGVPTAGGRAAPSRGPGCPCKSKRSGRWVVRNAQGGIGVPAQPGSSPASSAPPFPPPSPSLSPDCAAEEHRVLRNDGQLATECIQPYAAGVDARQQDASRIHGDEAEQRQHEGALAGTWKGSSRGGCIAHSRTPSLHSPCSAAAATALDPKPVQPTVENCECLHLPTQCCRKCPHAYGAPSQPHHAASAHMLTAFLPSPTMPLQLPTCSQNGFPSPPWRICPDAHLLTEWLPKPTMPHLPTCPPVRPTRPQEVPAGRWNDTSRSTGGRPRRYVAVTCG